MSLFEKDLPGSDWVHVLGRDDGLVSEDVDVETREQIQKDLAYWESKAQKLGAGLGMGAISLGYIVDDQQSLIFRYSDEVEADYDLQVLQGPGKVTESGAVFESLA
ncbi:MAG: hypothetical protein AAF514_21415 [Verrucomicrobiota bacterium]